MITRRRAISIALGSGALATLSATAFEAKEFWNAKSPSDWTGPEIHQLLNKSPWAKDASIKDTGQRGPLSSARPATHRSGRSEDTPAPTTGTPAAPVQWKAIVRWESALPIRAALNRGEPGEVPADYILNVLGEVPGVDTAGDGGLKEITKLEHKGDRIRPSRVEPAPANSSSADGTLFYFSRLLALRLEDKEVTFTTKLGPLEVRCKFALKDMLYRGKLEL